VALILRSVGPGRGARWVIDGFRLFARKPLLFTMLFIVFLFAALLVSLVPLLGGVVQMMAVPLLSLGFMIASRSALLDGPIHPAQFLEPLKGDPAKRRAMLILCVGYGVAAIAILLLADTLSDSAWGRLQRLMARSDNTQAEIDALLSEPGVMHGLIAALGLGTLLTIPFWHAPALVHWAGQGVGQALFSSTLAVWRCRGAFIMYFLTWVAVVLLFGITAALVFGLLGMPQLASVVGVPAGLAFTTVFYVSLIFTFNDSFGGGGVPEPAKDAQTTSV
jgi:hypothetical protein